MTPSKLKLPHPASCSLYAGLAVLASLCATPTQAENIHDVWRGEGSSAVVDQMLTTLAEEVRSSRLFLTTNTEQLRSLLLDSPCLEFAAVCHEHPVIPAAANLRLTPADIDLLRQHLNASLLARQLPKHQQQHLIEQLSQQVRGMQPLASL